MPMSESFNLYFIRHGESLGNIRPETYYEMPDWKIPLTNTGIEQATRVGKQLASDHIIADIITSPYVRAKETANLIKKESESWLMSIEENPLIREREWGSLREEVEMFATREERSHLFDFFRRPNGGESFADVYLRASIFLKSINRDSIIVSHGEFIKVALMILDGKNVDQFDDTLNIANCSVHYRTLFI